MTLTKILEFALGALASLGIVIGGVGYLVSQFNKTGRDEKNDVMDSANTLSKFWEDQANGYKTMLDNKEKELRQDIQTLTQKVGTLEGLLQSQTERADKLESELRLRNPEMQQFMSYMVETTKRHEEFHEQVGPILQQISNSLNDLHKISSSNNDLLNKEQGKDLIISTTVTKQQAGQKNNSKQFNRRSTDRK